MVAVIAVVMFFPNIKSAFEGSGENASDDFEITGENASDDFEITGEEVSDGSERTGIMLLCADGVENAEVMQQAFEESFWE